MYFLRNVICSAEQFDNYAQCSKNKEKPMICVVFLSIIVAYKWWIIAGLGLVVLVFCFRGNAPIGDPMRAAPSPGLPPGESWFIESEPTNETPVHSCSFVEFDGHGDYIDFKQHEHAWKKVEELANSQPLLLVTYCHGWKNNSQSTDVVKFTHFLGR